MILLGFALTGCTGSQFAGGGTAVGGKGTKKDSSGESKKGKEEDLGNPDDDEESDPAEEPVMVSGAFLTCRQDDTLPNDDTNVTAGCVAKVGEKSIDLSTYDEAKWTILDIFNIELSSLSATFAPGAAGSAWQMTIAVPRTGIELLKVKLTLKKKNKAASLYAPIEASGENGGEGKNPGTGAPGPNIKEFGKNDDYQLGDDSYENQGHYCDEQLQNIGLSGSSLSFTITVKTDTKLAVSVGHICGVNRSVNTVKVRDGSPVALFDDVIPTYSRDFAVPTLDLKAGSYTLELYSPKWAGGGSVTAGDRDDFVIGDFRFVFDGEVEIADPVADQVIEN